MLSQTLDILDFRFYSSRQSQKPQNLHLSEQFLLSFPVVDPAKPHTYRGELCVVGYLASRYMQPKGPWQWLRCCLSSGIILHFLLDSRPRPRSRATPCRHGRAPLSPSRSARSDTEGVPEERTEEMTAYASRRGPCSSISSGAGASLSPPPLPSHAYQLPLFLPTTTVRRNLLTNTQQVLPPVVARRRRSITCRGGARGSGESWQHWPTTGVLLNSAYERQGRTTYTVS